MNCFIQRRGPHSQLITKNCSSVSHFHHCGQILLPAVHFLLHTAIIFRAVLLWLDMAENLPTLTWWKSWQIELSQQFPVFVAVRGLIWSLTGRRASTQVLCGEKPAANYGAAVTGSGCRESHCPPRRSAVQPTRPPPQMRAPRYLGKGKQRLWGSVRAVVEDAYSAVNLIISNSSV